MNDSARNTTATVDILSEQEKPVVEVINPQGRSPVVLVCEHASNTIPDYFQNLGLADEVLDSHVCWDPGAKALAVSLSDYFDAPLVASRISRLVYDCNRPPDSPGAMPEKSELFEIPGNTQIDDWQRRARIEQVYEPFKHALAEVLDKKQASGLQPVLITVHSFTGVYFGRQREVEIGILHDRDESFANALLKHSAKVTALNVQRNQPYGPQDGVTHTLKEHALPRRLLNVMIEVRNDLLSDNDKVKAISEVMKKMIAASLEEINDVVTV